MTPIFINSQSTI